MSEGVDYSFSSPSASGLTAAGKTFAGRYVGPGFGKLLTSIERDALFAAGLDVFLLAEGNADSASGGYTVGVAHARSALDHARQLGAPDSAAIYFAVDYDVQANGWAGPREYLRGACDVLGRDRVGVYGSYNVMGWAQRDRVASWFFQTYAWSYEQWFDSNHIEQYHNGVIVAGGEVDLCRSNVANFGQWRADGRDPGQIFSPLEDEMTNEQFNLLWAAAWISQQLASMTDPIVVPANPDSSYPGYQAPNLLAQAVRASGDVDEAALAAALGANKAFADAIASGVKPGPTPAEIATAVVDEEHARLAE